MKLTTPFAAMIGAVALAATLGAGEGTYTPVDNWAQLPAGTKWETMSAVDVDAKGNVYAFQRGQPSKVMVFDAKGKLLRTWGEKMFPSAHGLRIDRQGNVWVTDRELHQVIKFTPEGKVLLELGTKGVAGDNTSTEALNGPSDVVVGPNGDIFVSDGESPNTRVVKFSKDGTFVKFWGTKGSGPGQLDVPHSIVMDSKGQLYVANRSNKRVEIFDQDGKYIAQITDVGTPYGLAITKEDVLYVSDGSQGQDNVNIYDLKTKKVVGHIAGLTGPHMLSVDTHGTVYVAEVRGASIKKFTKR